MMVLVAYDVHTESTGGKRRLRRVARLCQNHGQRVQWSVFECVVDPAQWTALRARLEREIDPDEDSLRFYFLGSNWRGHVEHVGVRPSYDLRGPSSSSADYKRTANRREVRAVDLSFRL